LTLLHRQFKPKAHIGAGVFPHALGAVGCGVPANTAEQTQSLAVRLPLELLSHHGAFVDIWQAAAPVRIERHGEVDLATDDRLAFGSLQLDERSAGGLRAAARLAYASIFNALDRVGCKHPLRFWNYVPHINQALDGLERYRHFNIGRQDGFLGAHRAAFAGAPAACAIGTEADHLIVYFLAASDAPVPIENPRQVSAYNYPAEYGPRTPTFSRATLVVGASPTLFISGTASIVGHRSEHPGDPSAQTHETFVNLRTVVDAANTRLPAPAFAVEQLLYTVYVRHAADLGVVRAQFLNEVGARSPAADNVVFLRADICRAELLVEIEATASPTS
jgi:enamine deaminase RidA (YjgF/YER057c/UK114 family)